jgi:hypothetical protein
MTDTNEVSLEQNTASLRAYAEARGLDMLDVAVIALVALVRDRDRYFSRPALNALRLIDAGMERMKSDAPDVAHGGE